MNSSSSPHLDSFTTERPLAKRRTKWTVAAILCLSAAAACGQGNEGFSNLPLESVSSYLSRSWTGDDAVTWTAEGARTDRTMNGKAICFGNSGNRWVTSPVYANGMGNLQFNYVREFTGTGARSIEVWVNGNKIGDTITVSATENTVVAYNENLNISGNVQLQIRSTGAAQVKLDDIVWTSFSGPATPAPTITSFAPTSGWIGTEVVITGTDFSLVSAVQFNGADALSYTVNSPTQITATVPTPPTTGKVSVTTASGTGLSAADFVADSSVDPDPPLVVSFSPPPGSTGVALNTNLVVTFNEPVQPDFGLIRIKRVSDNSDFGPSPLVETDPLVSINGAEVTITLGTELEPGVAYYVEIEATTFKDFAGNAFAGFTGSSTWSFTARDFPKLTTSGPYTENFAGFGVANPTLPEGWTLTGPVTTFSTDPNQQAWGTGFTGALREGTNLLGFQATSGASNLTATLQLINDTGNTVTDLTVSYIGKVERTDQTRTPTWAVTVAGQPVPALTYSTADGDDVLRIASVSGLNIAPGGLFSITWFTDRGLPNSGGSKQIGLTNISVAEGATIFPPSVAGVAPDYSSLTTSAIDVASEVTSDGGGTLSARGFVYSTAADNAMPEIGGIGVTNVPDGLSEIGGFGASLSSLTPGTEYVVRSYATNEEGPVYSAALSVFTLATPPSLVTAYMQPFYDFNGSMVAGGLPAGWTVLSSGGLNGFAGTWGPATSAGGLLGNTPAPNGVLGYQHVGSSGDATVTLSLTNNTGATLTQLYVSYRGRVERTDQTRHPAWAVTVAGQSVAGLGYSTGAGADQTKTELVTGLSIPNGTTFTITWLSDRGFNDTGGSRQIGIANVYVGIEPPPAGGYDAWAATNAGGQGPELDWDNDGVPNGVEFFMDSPAGFTANPGLVGGAVTWPNGGNLLPSEYGTKFKVQISSTLAPGGWTDILVDDPNLINTADTLSYTLPTGTGPLFVRLVVTP